MAMIFLTVSLTFVGHLFTGWAVSVFALALVGGGGKIVAVVGWAFLRGQQYNR